MEIIIDLWSIITNLDEFLIGLNKDNPNLIYILVFLIIFLETGLVIFPFLPGDTLIFLLGALAGADLINEYTMGATIILAAFIGDNTNYVIGRYLRGKIKPSWRFIKERHIKKVEEYYKKWGGLTLVIARFFAIIRTYAPFVGGLSRMRSLKFMLYSIIGAISWVVILMPLGYMLGQNEYIKSNINLIIMAVIVISLMPLIIGSIIRLKRKTG